ncbi:MAG: metal ABC transporter solute-binding protein, Zn/Mn family [Spirochaetaceae bacterium]
MNVAGIFMLVLCLSAPATGFAGGGQEAGPREGVIEVYASVAPQADIIQRIGGERVSVGVLIGPGQDAHTFDPSPRQIERLSRAEILFSTGLEYEANIVDALSRSAPGVQIVRLYEGIELREIERHYVDPNVPHSHENEPGDPHIWLGFDEVRVQARHIRNALTEARPDLESEFERRYEEFLELVTELEQEVEELLAHLRGGSIMVYHPAFGYLLDPLDITQIGIEAGGREPSSRQLRVAIEDALAAGITVVFTQPEYTDIASRAIARAVGAQHETVTDLGSDWPELMLDIAETFAQEGR